MLGLIFNLSWDEPEPYEATTELWGVGTGTPSRTRQGGNILMMQQ